MYKSPKNSRQFLATLLQEAENCPVISDNKAGNKSPWIDPSGVSRGVFERIRAVAWENNILENDAILDTINKIIGTVFEDKREMAFQSKYEDAVFSLLKSEIKKDFPNSASEKIEVYIFLIFGGF